MSRSESYKIIKTHQELSNMADVQAVGLIRSIYLAQGGGQGAAGEIFAGAPNFLEALRRIEARAQQRSGNRGLLSGTWEWMTGRDQRGASEKTLAALKNVRDRDGCQHNLIGEFKRRFSASASAVNSVR